jgi:hypothetical protein
MTEMWPLEDIANNLKLRFNTVDVIVESYPSPIEGYTRVQVVISTEKERGISTAADFLPSEKIENIIEMFAGAIRRYLTSKKTEI